MLFFLRPSCIHGLDKDGYIVYFEKIGKNSFLSFEYSTDWGFDVGQVDARSVMDFFGVDVMTRFHIFLAELGVRIFDRYCLTHGLLFDGGKSCKF